MACAVLNREIIMDAVWGGGSRNSQTNVKDPPVLLSLLLPVLTHFQVREREVEGVGWGAAAEAWMVSGGGRLGGTQRGSPDLCARRYQRPLHLAVSKPLQNNNKLWTLFDRCLSQMKTGQQMHAWWNRGEPAEAFFAEGWGLKEKTGNSTLTQKRANVNNQMSDT